MTDAAQDQPPIDAPVGTSLGTILLAVRRGVLSSGLTFVINLTLVPFILHHVGDHTYGVWLTFSSTLAVATLADVGVRTEVARRCAAANGADDRAGITRAAHQGMTVLFTALLPASLVIIAFADPITRFVFPGDTAGYSHAELALILRILIAVLAAAIIMGGYFSVLRGLQRSDIEALGRSASVLATGAVTVVVLLLGWSLWGLVLAALIGTCALAAVQWIAVRRLAPYVTVRFERMSSGELRSYVGLSGLALLAQIGDVVDSQWDKIVLSHFVGPEAVTFFHIGSTLVLQGKIIAVLPLAPLMVALSEVGSGAEALERAQALHRTLAKVGMLATALITGAAFVFAPAFIQLWLGPGFHSAARVAQLFAIAVLFNLLGAPHAFQALAEARHDLVAWSAATNMGLNAVLSLVLVREVGLYGAAYGSIIGNIAGAALIVVVSRGRLSYWQPPPLAALATTIVLSALMVLTHLDHITSWVMLVVWSAVFVTMAGVVGAVAERLSWSEIRHSLG